MFSIRVLTGEPSFAVVTKLNSKVRDLTVTAQYVLGQHFLATVFGQTNATFENPVLHFQMVRGLVDILEGLTTQTTVDFVD